MVKNIFIIIFLSLVFLNQAIADCNGCFDLVNVLIKLKNGQIKNTHMYIDLYRGKNVKQPNELEKGLKYYVVDDYIDVCDGRLNLDEVSAGISASILVNETYKHTFDPDKVASVKEISRKEYVFERSIGINSYKTIKNQKPVDYYSFYDGDFGFAFVAISYNKKLLKNEIQKILTSCGFNGEKSIDCMRKKTEKLEKVYFFYVELEDDGC